MATNPDASIHADVMVIGGGLIGSTLALRLAQAKLKVHVFDAGDPGAEASSAAAGMIAPQGETLELDAFFAFCAASHALYEDFVREVEDLSHLAVGYHREGSILVGMEDRELAELEKAYWAQTRSGLPLERLSTRTLQERMEGLSPQIKSALGVSEDHWVDNELLTRAVIKAAQRLGVVFHAHTPVRRISLADARVESLAAGSADLLTRYSAGAYILAAGCWSADLGESLGIRTPVKPCRGQMLEFETPEDLPFVIRCGIHYIVPRAGRRLLVGTTSEYEGFDKAVTAEGLRAILNGVTRFFPRLKEFRFRRAWAGLRPDTADHLPMLGRSAIDNLIFATGHFRNGILLAPLTARLISELVVTGQTSQPLNAYDPMRFEG
jgi:glycine oxidase